MNTFGSYVPKDERDAEECAVFAERVRLNQQGDLGDVVSPNRRSMGDMGNQPKKTPGK